MDYLDLDKFDCESEKFHTERFGPDDEPDSSLQIEVPREEIIEVPREEIIEVEREEIIEVERDMKAERRADIEGQRAQIDTTVLNLKMLLGHDDRDVRRVERRLAVLKQRGEAALEELKEPWTR